MRIIFTKIKYCLLSAALFVSIKSSGQICSQPSTENPNYKIDTICGDYSLKIINFIPVSTFRHVQSTEYPAIEHILQNMQVINKNYCQAGIYFHIPVLETLSTSGSYHDFISNYVFNHELSNSIFGFYRKYNDTGGGCI